MMKTYAFAHKQYPTSVRLWCRSSARGRNFWVINGAWRYDPRVDKDYLLIWEGEVPEDLNHERHYSEAIKWIQGQVDG